MGAVGVGTGSAGGVVVSDVGGLGVEDTTKVAQKLLTARPGEQRGTK